MIKLVFGAFVAIDTAAVLFFFFLGLAAAESSHTSRWMVALVMLVLPALVLAASVMVFLRASAPVWRVVAFVLAAAPLVISVTSQAYSDARIRANSNGKGQLLFFPSGPQQDLADAITRHDAVAVDTLLPRAQINAPGMDGMTMLVLALRQLRTAPLQQDIVRKLIAAGADPNAGTPYERPLEMALQVEGKTGAAPVALLLEAGADPNRTNSSGTPIFFGGAGNSSSLESLKLLLKHGASLDATSTRGETILIYAATARNWHAARFLLQQGADPSLGRAFKGKTFADLVNDAVQEQTSSGAQPSAQVDSALDVVASMIGQQWTLEAWRRESAQRGLVRDSSITPAEIVADFDGDGRPDMAWAVRQQRTGERGILIVHANGRAAQQCGAGVAFGNGGANYDWMDSWQAVPHSGGTGAALLVAKTESASARIEFRAGRYQWQQRGD